MTLFSFLIFILALLFSTTSSFSVSTYYSGYKYGYIDDSGKVVIDIQFDQAHNFKDGIAAVYKDRK
jgi:Mn2+/Fe2+ NRAMP family transporter